MAWFLICTVLVLLVLAVAMTAIAKMMFGDVTDANRTLNMFVDNLANVKTANDRVYCERDIEKQRGVFRTNMLILVIGVLITTGLWTLVYFGYTYLHPLLSSVYKAILSL